MCTKHVVLDELSKGPGRTTAQTKIRQPKNFRKVETATGRAENVTQFLSYTTEIHKYDKINTVDQISFLARIVR